MTKVWLNFKDENGEPKRVLVDGDRFTIGRTPDNDLQIKLSNLSREHARIERFADVCILSDSGSSNGTTLNGQIVDKPFDLRDGDLINLGEAIEIEVELFSDQTPKAQSKEDVADKVSENPRSNSPQDESAGSGIPIFVFILAPVLGILILFIVGAAFLFFRKEEPVAVKPDTDYVYSTKDIDDEPINTKSPERIESPTPPSASNNTTTSTNNPTPEATLEAAATPKTSNDFDKIEADSAAFLRKISLNDTKAFLTSKRIELLSAKINQVKNSTGLAENIRNAKKNIAQITTLAKSKNIKPQFLATAALTKLGNDRGDVVATAQGMAEILDNLSIVLGNELADDNLLVMAAYEQGAAGQNLAMRDTVANLTKQFPSKSSREIRTIWFLKENGKLSDSQYNFALNFLAIGTIAQNPKDFSVQADALSF